MPLTAAERMKRYREKLKENPEKYEAQKRKHANLVKEKTKKISDLPDEEKEKLRKKWRVQKQKQKKNKSGECDSSKACKNVSKIKKGNNKAKRSRITRQYNAALKKINTLTKTLQATRKQFYRYKVKTKKEVELLQESVTKMKIRGEVLESALKSTYNKCRTHEQKRLFKGLIDNEKVKAMKMRTKVANLLGLKGKIRKRKQIMKNVKISTELEKFFIRDDVSRITAGKKECRTSAKKKEQIRYLTDTLHTLYQKYKLEGGKYSFATFYKYKPFYVLSPNVANRDTCQCVKHGNIEFKLHALKRKGLLTNLKSMTDVLRKICCDINSYECLYGKCQKCNTYSLDYQLKEGQNNLNVEWDEWRNIDHKYEKNENGTVKTFTTKKPSKVRQTGTIDMLIEKFENSIPAFKIHYFTWIHQQRQYQKCIEGLKINEILIICDFSQNYLCKMATEIQSMHFGAAKAQITLHTGMIYWNDLSQSFCTVSDSNCHEPQGIWAHLLPIIKLARETRPTTSVVHFYSDGPSTQYRQKKNFYLHNLFTCRLGLDYSTWSFSESGHGKGVADGIGGAVKRALDRQVAYGRDITNAQEAYNVLQNCMKTVKCLLINNAEIENIGKLLPKQLKAVPGTMKIHQITSRSRDIITHRTHSCFCSTERGMGVCYSPKKFVFGQLQEDDIRTEVKDNKQNLARHTTKKMNTDEINDSRNKKNDDMSNEKGRNKMSNERGCEKTNDNNFNIELTENTDEGRYEKIHAIDHDLKDDDVIVLFDDTDYVDKQKKDEDRDKTIDSIGHDLNDDDVTVFCDDVDDIAKETETTEKNLTEFLIQWDDSLNSTALISPVLFDGEIDIDTEKETLDCTSEISATNETEKLKQKTKKSTYPTLETDFGKLHSPNLKRKYSMASRIDSDIKRLRSLDPIPKKNDNSGLSNKENKVTKRAICYICKTDKILKAANTAKCMVCNNLVCWTCSQGQQCIDYICDSCLIGSGSE